MPFLLKKINIFLTEAVFFLFLSFLFISCSSPIYITHPLDVKKLYQKRDAHSLQAMIDLIRHENRSIKNVALVKIDSVIDQLQKKKYYKKEIFENTEVYLSNIKKRLIQEFESSQDFNSKNLILWALRHFETDSTIQSFYTQSLFSAPIVQLKMVLDIYEAKEKLLSPDEIIALFKISESEGSFYLFSFLFSQHELSKRDILAIENKIDSFNDSFLKEVLTKKLKNVSPVVMNNQNLDFLHSPVIPNTTIETTNLELTEELKD